MKIIGVTENDASNREKLEKGMGCRIFLQQRPHNKVGQARRRRRRWADQSVYVHACVSFCETVDKKCNALKEIDSFKPLTFETANRIISIYIRDAFFLY